MTERDEPRDRDDELRAWTATEMLGPAEERAAEPTEEVERPEPAAPKPPPATWGPWHDGPGSPAGSVRPPDTRTSVDPAETPSHRARPGVLMVLVAALVGAVIGTASTLALTRAVPDIAAPDLRAPDIQVQDTEGLTVAAAVAEAVTPSVVRVDMFTTAQGTPVEQGVGSGVIFRSDGYIITNNHVVEDADELQVVLADGQHLEAEIVGTDPLTDLAVLRVDEDGLPAINLREEPVRVGETAIAIGAPFQLNFSVTAGIVSGVDRSLEVPIDEGFISIPNVIQTDAAINPGNSGGALVDARGRLIGINTAILTRVQPGEMPGGFIGIGFAINAFDAVDIADRLIDQGFVRHARLGIQGGTVMPRVARERELDATEGVLVERAQPGGPADEAGIRSGDIIVEAEGERITRMDELVAVIRQHEPGDTFTVVVVRDGETIPIEVVLGEWD